MRMFIFVLFLLVILALFIPIYVEVCREEKRKIAAAQQKARSASQRLGVTIYPKKKDDTK